MADNKPTLHSLNNSQSQRILWLLEELNIPYNLINHLRNPSDHPTAPFSSPPGLKGTGPYGKAPVLKTGLADGFRYITESSAIATYLIRTFDKENKFHLLDGDWIHDEVVVSLVSTSLSRSGLSALFLDFGAIKIGEGPFAAAMSGKALWAILGHLERELKQSPTGGYFGGENLSRADILAEFHISMARQRNWVDMKKEYPVLDEWLDRIYARDAWKRGLKKGNGYDLTFFPKIPERA